MLFKKLFFPLFIYVLLLLGFGALLYALALPLGSANWPYWMNWLFPLVIAVLSVWVFKHKMLVHVPMKPALWGLLDRKNLILFTIIPFLVLLLFQSLSKSIRYNLADVQRLESINDLQPNEQATFLEVKEWYVDRLQVVPIKSVEPYFGNFSGKVHVKVMFLVPVFTRADAYRTYAKAWLAFEYSEIMPISKVLTGEDEDFINSSTRNFKMMNLLAYNYFEVYPRGHSKDIYLELARNSNYHRSGFSHILRGQDVERDVLGLHYFKYFLFLIVLIGIPGVLLGSLLMYFWRDKSH